MKSLVEQQAQTIEDQQKLILQQSELIQQQSRKIDLLEQRVDALLRRIYGKSSEQLDSSQLQFELDEIKKLEAVSLENEEELAAKENKKPRKKSQPRLPDNLPVETEVLIPLAVQADPEAYEKIGEKVTERLDIKPAKLTLKRTIRPSYKTKENNSIVISPLPPCLLEKSILTPSLLSYILCSKYCDHLPLYRQEQIFKRRYGVSISGATLCEWVNIGAETLDPLYKKLSQQLRTCGSLQIDETTVDYLTKGEGSKTGYFWIYANQSEGILYDWQNNRSNTCLDSVLINGQEKFKGLIQCDGYEAYQTWVNRNEDVKLLGCWVHTRRKFFEARAQDPDAFKALQYIAKLYALDTEYRKWLQHNNHPPEAIQYYRKRYSRKTYQEMGRFLRRIRDNHLPKTLLRKAIDYALNQWLKLGRAVSCSPYDLDNNYAENSVRPLKIGAKNWMFIGADKAGWRSAVIYTMIENIRRANKDPYAYLKWVFEKLPSMTNQDNLDELMPKAWLKKQAELEQERQQKLEKAS